MPDFGDVDPNTGLPSARTEFEGSVDPNAPSVANGQISAEQWAAYQAKRRKDAIIGVLTTLGGMFAAPAASYGSGAAAAGAGGGLAPISGGAPAAAAAAGSGGMFGGLSARDIAALAAGVTGTVGGAIAGRNTQQNMQPNTMTSDPNLQRLLATMQGRLDKSEPLLDSVFSMANGLLPTQYQKGGGGMG